MTATSSPEMMCARIARRLADTVGSRKYSMWFERTAELDYRNEDQQLRVTVPNRFVADRIGRDFQTELRQCASAELGRDVDIQFDIDPSRFGAADDAGNAAVAVAATPAAPAAAAAPVASPRPVDSSRYLRHRLEDFVVGPSNELAYACAQRLLEDARDPSNPLFIHGGCGLGKTHLLQGICRRMLELHPGSRVLYMTGEQFTNEFVAAISTNKLGAFRRRIRKLDLLAVDDVRFFENKEKTQQEFLHSFDAIELGGARVVLASDSHPRLIKQFSEALVSRCIRGMVVQIKPPDDETRRRIVAALALRRRLTLGAGVADLIADQCCESVREIEGLLAKVHALASLSRTTTSNTIGRAMIDHLFQSDLRHGPAKSVRFQTIVDVVCEHLNVSAKQALGAGRHRNVVLARSLIAHLARQLTSMSFPEIAAAMGKGNHSTIVCAAQRIERQIADNRQILLPHRGEQINLGSLTARLKQLITRV